MWKVRTPAFSAAVALETCTAIVDDRQSVARRSLAEIVRASSIYVTAARASEMHTLRPADFMLTHVTGEDMKWLYENRLSRGSGRAIYEAIRAAPRHRLCPMCGVRQVRDLDHVLPKAAFPALTIDPRNLVPVCAECNNIKGEHFPRTATEQLIHPYFDDIEDSRWLYATIRESTDLAAFVFSVRPAQTWHPELTARVQWQFDKLKLGKLYASHAGQELARIRRSLVNIFSRSGAEGVRFRLAEDAESRLEDEVNSWNSAMYEAMATSPWFYSGGFALVG